MRLRLLALPVLLLATTSGLMTPTAATASAVTAPVYRDDVLRNARLWTDPHSPVKQAAEARRHSDPTGAAALDKVAGQPRTEWFGDWNPSSTVRSTVASRAAQTRAAGAVPVFVLYAVPHRDCAIGSGLDTSGYRLWVREVAAGLGAGPAAVVLEPDALGLISCLSPAQQQERTGLLADAVDVLRANGKTGVYLDASSWVPERTMAARLKAAGISRARGFSLNVSNYNTTESEVSYGRALKGLVESKGFLVDTSRNGLGPTQDAQWCNAPGRALGRKPTTSPWISGVDALLWIKPPGESDGVCRWGEPAAGAFWPDYAIGLAQRAAW